MDLRAALCVVLTLSLFHSGSALATAQRVTNLGKVSKAQLTGADRVSRVGDVNGDGVQDVLVADCSKGEQAGSTYVVFGPFDEEQVDLDNLADRGFAINGSQSDDFACLPAAAGDVNADGLDDVLIGAYGASSDGRSGSGKAYVVFGKSDTASIELVEFDQNRHGTKGFRIDGPSEGARAASHVDGLGDVNGDGLADVAITGPFAGAVYVVFGKTDPVPVDLLTFELGQQMDRGYRIITGSPNRNFNLTVGGAGDANGDGKADVVIGYIPNLSSTGFGYVVFGKADSEDIDVHDLGSHGFEVKGTKRRSSTGDAVTGIGDINSDGKDDVAIGAPFRNCCGAGKVFVIFGKKSTKTLRTSRLGQHGYTIKPVRPNDGTGLSIDGAGDINGDGFADFLVGVPESSLGGRKASGSIYVVYGGTRDVNIQLSELGRRGYRLDGTRELDQLGASLAGPGDVTADGVPDILSGVYRAPGIGYVISGHHFR
jgi:hypothetical protein